MKNIFQLLTIISLLCLLSACATKEDKAKQLVKKHVLQRLSDENSYNPIEFGALDTAFSRVQEDPTFVAYKEKADAEYNEWALFEPQSKKYNALRDTINRFLESYQPKPIGWKMRHSFKANMGMGTYDKIEVDVVMNWNVDSVYYILR
ncbi:MAG: hypothetical protein LBL94_06770 [Prevotellaceae bacterium]|jgi:hypothetical protein|nr:hypothetical protein [Prevotellaceae bacterium]